MSGVIVTPGRRQAPVVVEINTGPQGVPGSAGAGVPVGGTTGQVLAKTSSANYATAWVSGAGGGGATEVYVQPANPNMTGVGIWIQTGLAPGGNGFTFWFEDGL